MTAAQIKRNISKLLIIQSIELQRMNSLLERVISDSRRKRVSVQKQNHTKMLLGITMTVQASGLNPSLGMIALGLDRIHNDCRTTCSTFNYPNGDLMFEAFVTYLIEDKNLDKFKSSKLFSFDIESWFKGWYDLEYIKQFGPKTKDRAAAAR